MHALSFIVSVSQGFPGSPKAGGTRDMGWISGPGRPLREGSGKPLQCSCLENPVDRGAGGLQSLWSQQAGHD